MDERIKLNKDKTIKYIDCNECGYKISFVDDITPEMLKNMAFDCPHCKQTYFLDEDKIITAKEHNEKTNKLIRNTFNKFFKGGNK